MTKNFTTKAMPEKPKTPRKRANSDNPLTLTDYHKQALIGLTLGDISLEKATRNSNVRLRFDQSISIHKSISTFYTNFLRCTLLVHLNLLIENLINELVKFITVLSLRLECYLVLIIYGTYFT